MNGLSNSFEIEDFNKTEVHTYPIDNVTSVVNILHIVLFLNLIPAPLQIIRRKHQMLSCVFTVQECFA